MRYEILNVKQVIMPCVLSAKHGVQSIFSEDSMCPQRPARGEGQARVPQRHYFDEEPARQVHLGAAH
eukprot:1400379-Heterocapsa_arctica.AAC.1